nr:MAG TPA: hypothetical protein [Caudoviricetes sp.]
MPVHVTIQFVAWTGIFYFPATIAKKQSLKFKSNR